MPVFLALIISGLLMLLLPSAAQAAPAAAPTAPSAGVVAEPVDPAEAAYQFTGLVSFEGEPVANVRITVEGEDVEFSGEGVTNEEGRYAIGVMEAGSYIVTIDQASLPEGVTVAEGEDDSRPRSTGQSQRVNTNFALGAGERSTTSFSNQFFERLMNGINFGLLLGLASLGISLVFGTTGLTNFAHAEVVTLGAIIAMVFGTQLSWPMWIVFPIVLILAAIVGWLFDRGLWQPLRGRGVGLIPLMIVSIGLSFVLRYLYQFFIGGGTYQLPGAGQAKLQIIGPIRLSVIDMVSMAVSTVVLIAVAVWLTRTRIGKATRAISDNPSLAAASGIDVDRVIRIVWMLATSLAALAGVLWAYFRPGLRWDMGMQILLLIFAAVVLGGLGTAFGAMLGALIVGILVEVSTLWIPSDIKYVGALGVLIVILLVRPQGLLGRRERLG
ncbi:MAG: branched-chain amino acid ABC transporter permease [Actinomycetia bacterium]|nr:branched-chain amino acid ABC transporter permease [Actinomycetes bacterium]